MFKYQKINIKYLILTLFISLYISDLFTGLVHIFLDNYKGNNKFIKPFAISFQKHHDDPKSLNNLPFFEIIWGTSNFFFIPFAFLIFNKFILLKNLNNTIKYIIFFEIIFCFFSSFSQITHTLCHKMNHASPIQKNKKTYRILNFLQKNNIILNPIKHKIHHKYLDINYSILNGWSNPLLNKIIKKLE